jgi:hypothetical protein
MLHRLNPNSPFVICVTCMFRVSISSCKPCQNSIYNSKISIPLTAQPLITIPHLPISSSPHPTRASSLRLFVPTPHSPTTTTTTVLPCPPHPGSFRAVGIPLRPRPLRPRTHPTTMKIITRRGIPRELPRNRLILHKSGFQPPIKARKISR